MTSSIDGLYRVCVKIYGSEPGAPEGDAEAFVPIFHEWIQQEATDGVLFDVADYAHVPEGPGIVLVTHETAFALDRTDGRFGLLAQRRVPIEGGAVAAVERTLRKAVEVATRLQADPRLGGRVVFDPSRVVVESNDRLRAPNTAEGALAFEAVVRAAIAGALGAAECEVRQVDNDPRDRLALEVLIAAGLIAG
jgi:hypothetical protein